MKKEEEKDNTVAENGENTEREEIRYSVELVTENEQPFQFKSDGERCIYRSTQKYSGISRKNIVPCLIEYIDCCVNEETGEAREPEKADFESWINRRWSKERRAKEIEGLYSFYTRKYKTVKQIEKALEENDWLDRSDKEIVIDLAENVVCHSTEEEDGIEPFERFISAKIIISRDR